MNADTTCKKVRFSTKEFADEHIQRIQKTSSRSVIPVRSYLCTRCNLWHLTKALNINEVRLMEENARLTEELNELKSLQSVKRQASLLNELAAMKAIASKYASVVKQLNTMRDTCMQYKLMLENLNTDPPVIETKKDRIERLKMAKASYKRQTNSETNE